MLLLIDFENTSLGTHVNFHVSESADVPETTTLLPQLADRLIAQSSFAVAVGTFVSLEPKGNQQGKESTASKMAMLLPNVATTEFRIYLVLKLTKDQRASSS